jgi:hypothetical protein
MTNPIPQNKMFVTPAGISDLAEMIESIGTPEEQRLAWLGASMALNLAHQLHEKSLEGVA